MGKQPCPPTPARLLAAVAGPSAAAAKQGRLGSSAGGSTTGDGRRIQEIKNEDDGVSGHAGQRWAELNHNTLIQ